jgi:hypothetical protein
MNEIFRMLGMDNDLVHENGPNGKSPLGEQVLERDTLRLTTTDKAARALHLGAGKFDRKNCAFLPSRHQRLGAIRHGISTVQ